MDLVLCHTTADFDTLGAAVGITRLQPGSRIVLTGGCHPAVQEFLALHRDEYPLIERRSVNPARIRSLVIVDTQQRDRLGKAAEWLDSSQVSISLYDHHLQAERDILATQIHIEAVGATTTLIVEQLQQQQLTLTATEATVMALGIHVDTGSLTFDQSTPRDALALAWLMSQGASLGAIAEYVEPGLSAKLQALLTSALHQMVIETIRGYQIAWVVLETDTFVPGLSTLVSRLIDLSEIDALILGAPYCRSGRCQDTEASGRFLSVIGRTRIPGTDLLPIFKPIGGGGHPRAAAASLKGVSPQLTIQHLYQQLVAQIPHPPTARELMSSPVRTIRPDTTVDEAQRILLRYGHSGLTIVDTQDHLVGIIARRDIDIALHHGFSHAPVKGYMTTDVKTITPETTLPDIEELMVTYDIGRLPVLAAGQLMGIVTRTDVLRQLHQFRAETQPRTDSSRSDWQPLPTLSAATLQHYLTPALWEVLQAAAQAAQERGWHLYLVGGAVRDLFLAKFSPTDLPSAAIDDIDLVVDGCHPRVDSRDRTAVQALEGAGVELAQVLKQQYPQARLEIHGRFQTAALLWHKDPVFDSLWVDIATARTEFYPYPAANPEVEASSLQQDLYRRDFTINALAVRLTPPRPGELLDFFGGFRDLQAQQIRVLHANSFIEDPTRIYRAVRFAVRLGFQIEPQTEGYIRYAIASGIYDRVQLELAKAPALQTRLKSELKSILQAPYWQNALKLLADLGALRCIHPALTLDTLLWKQLRLLERGLQHLHQVPSLPLSSSPPLPPPPSLSPPLSSPLPPPWQQRLEVLIARLAPDDRAAVASHLQLPIDSIERLRSLADAERQVLSVLSGAGQPVSWVVHQLEAYALPTLVLIAIRAARSQRRLIWRHVTDWSHVHAPLTGDDLKALGYRPGPRFKQILSGLRNAKLDGRISDDTSALGFLQEHFPR
jgi:tRNA nucleotidyltransferase (CCA-adding enzyme)